MQVHIRIVDNDGNVVHEKMADLIRPTDYKTSPDQPLIDGKYKIFGYVWQPIVVLDPRLMMAEGEKRKD